MPDDALLGCVAIELFDGRLDPDADVGPIRSTRVLPDRDLDIEDRITHRNIICHIVENADRQHWDEGMG